MTHRHFSHASWRLALMAIVLLSLCLGGLTPAQARTAAFAITPLTSFADGTYPAGLVYGPQQSFWFTLSGTGEIGQLSGAGNTALALPDSSALPMDITLGPDLALWFSQKQAHAIGQLTPPDTLAGYTLGAGVHSPTGAALGQDLAVWFTEFDGNRIGRISPQGEISTFDLPQAGSNPFSIISDVDGNLWFSEWGTYRLGSITLQGEIQEFDIPTPPARPVDLLYGPDGGLWLIFNAGKRIARFDLAAESFTYFQLPTQSPSLADLTIGPDGRIWFVGTLTMGSFAVLDGAPVDLVEELLPEPVYTYSGRSQIISGPDDNLVFTLANGSTVYQVPLTPGASRRDLQMVITQRPPLVLSGGEFYVDAQLVNWSNSAATDVKINLTLDEGIHFVGVDLPGAVCVDNDPQVQCSLPLLDAASTLPVRVTLTVDKLYQPFAERVLALDVTSMEGDYQPTNNRVLLFTRVQQMIHYFNDFSAGADDYWSHQDVAAPVDGLDVLGLFDNQQVTFNYPVLPPHDRTWLCFDLYILGGWDGTRYVEEGQPGIIGPDFWVNYLDDTRLLMTTYSNQSASMQSFPANYQVAEYPYQTGAGEVGEFDGDSAVQDATYNFCYRLPHTRLELKMLFMGLNLDELGSEQWAIDNVDMKIFYDDQLGKIYMPLVSH